MGKNKIHQKLDNELPSVKYGKDAGVRVFSDDKDREQFIYALAVVVTENGQLDLSEHDFKILYSRLPHKTDIVVARLVASKDGIITAKIEPEGDGSNQWEAFLALRRDVEVRLELILKNVPNVSGMGGKSSGSQLMDQPPAYQRDLKGAVEVKR